METNRRGIAQCAKCEEIYAVRVREDGTIYPIGAGACVCGSTEFALINPHDVGESSA